MITRWHNMPMAEYDHKAIISHIPSTSPVNWPHVRSRGWNIRFITRNMMTSSNGSIFRVTGPLCGEFTGHRWTPCTRASDEEFWCVLFALRLNKRLNKQSWGWWFETPSCPLWRHCNARGRTYMLQTIPAMSVWWLHKSQNVPVPYPTMHHFVTGMCTCVHVSVTKRALGINWLLHCGICEMVLLSHIEECAVSVIMNTSFYVSLLIN